MANSLPHTPILRETKKTVWVSCDTCSIVDVMDRAGPPGSTRQRVLQKWYARHDMNGVKTNSKIRKEEQSG